MAFNDVAGVNPPSRLPLKIGMGMYIERRPDTIKESTTISTSQVKPLCSPNDISDVDYLVDSAFPGQFPYTRGIHPTGYRGKLWTMRQVAGIGSPEDTNKRFKYLIAKGQTGLSVAYDLPTLMGYDADSPLCEGEVGKGGVSVS